MTGPIPHNVKSRRDWAEYLTRRRSPRARRKSYSAYIASTQWKKIRFLVLEHCGRRCSRCGEFGIPLQVHHKNYDHIGAEHWEDLTPHCQLCHESADLERRRTPPRKRKKRKP